MSVRDSNGKWSGKIGATTARQSHGSIAPKVAVIEQLLGKLPTDASERIAAISGLYRSLREVVSKHLASTVTHALREASEAKMNADDLTALVHAVNDVLSDARLAIANRNGEHLTLMVSKPTAHATHGYIQLRASRPSADGQRHQFNLSSLRDGEIDLTLIEAKSQTKLRQR